uniref:Uncharacterized protein n=1 Tax=Heterorhabditis bacteriophora TaxID=37862 RepID=A0A1I7XJL9_HETBA
MYGNNYWSYENVGFIVITSFIWLLMWLTNFDLQGPTALYGDAHFSYPYDISTTGPRQMQSGQTAYEQYGRIGLFSPYTLPPPPPLHPTDDVSVSFTAGETGRPRIVMEKHSSAQRNFAKVSLYIYICKIYIRYLTRFLKYVEVLVRVLIYIRLDAGMISLDLHRLLTSMFVIKRLVKTAINTENVVITRIGTKDTCQHQLLNRVLKIKFTSYFF